MHHMLSQRGCLNTTNSIHKQQLNKGWINKIILKTVKRWKKLKYLTRLVMANISGLFLYGLASCESKGLMPDFISMFASTRYFRHVVLLK